jgi:hypothetical protein
MSHLIKKLEQSDKNSTLLTPIVSEDSSEETSTDDAGTDQSTTNSPVMTTEIPPIVSTEVPSFEDIIIEEENEVMPVTDENIDTIIDVSGGSFN